MVDRTVIVNNIMQETLTTQSIKYEDETLLKVFLVNMLKHNEITDANVKEFFIFTIICSKDI
jgi:hypothetical protein